MVIFTEYCDTLRYLWERISILVGRAEYMVYIDDSVHCEERRAIGDRLRNDPAVYFVLATDDAA